MIEMKPGGFDKRVRCAYNTVVTRLSEPCYASFLFYFSLNLKHGLNPARLDVVNRLMCVLPSHVLTFQSVLTKKVS